MFVGSRDHEAPVLGPLSKAEHRFEGHDRLGEIVGASPAMKELFRQIEMVARTDVTVLVEGETGTGKDLVARTLHRMSLRALKPYVAFNASNLQEQLFESELFGHVKGAFSGAHDRHEGLALAANAGTLFIDEVGELQPANQAKLLRFLDTKEVRAVGSTGAKRVDVRIICATNRDLMAEVKRGKFREDLYYRLRVITLEVPPLRKRRSDVALLIHHFLDHFCSNYGKRIPGISDEVWEILLEHSWKGNVRELENEMERAVVMTRDDETIQLEVLSPEIRSIPGEATKPGAKMGLREYRRSVERQIMIETLERTGWNVTAAAKELDISRVGLTKKMKRLGVCRPERTSRRT
jgi:transcriptional regulator with GAF, ATPase, and Fis domain